MSWKESKVHLMACLPESGLTCDKIEFCSLSAKLKSEATASSFLVSRDEDSMPPPALPPKSSSISSSSLKNSLSSSLTIVTSSSDHSSSSSSSIEFDGNDQVLCRVCGDKASGFHYGVHSCEGCKGFFRRSIQQKIQYRPCTKNQQCNILRINRNRCQYCRLKKCIAAGMSRDAVRFGRVPKREKAKIMAAMESSRMKSQENRVLSEMNDDAKIIEEIVRAHYDNCDYTKSKMGPFIAKAKENPIIVPITGNTCPMKGRAEDSFLDQFSERFMDHVRQVCTFAKRIPGFECLHNDDKVTLLKSCVFEVLLVRLSGLFDNESLVCLNGDVIRRDTINQMPAGNAKFLINSIFELAERLNQFCLSDAQIGLFCAVVIITPDRPGLRNSELVSKMQNKLKNVLSNVMRTQCLNNSISFSQLVSLAQELRTLNTLHTEKFLQLQCKVSSESSTDSRYLYGKNGDWSPISSTESFSENERRSPLSSVSSSESFPESRKRRQDDDELQSNVCPFKVRKKSESPSDSGIDSPKALVNYSTNTSLCSSPFSEDVKEDEELSLFSIEEEQHPLLKRALQQPPQITNNLTNFQKNVYKPHKKFRRFFNADDCPSSSTNESFLHNKYEEQSSPKKNSTHITSNTSSSSNSRSSSSLTEGSLLASTLSKAIPVDQRQRNEMLAQLIFDGNGMGSFFGNSSSEPGESSQPLNLSTRTPTSIGTDISSKA